MSQPNPWLNTGSRTLGASQARAAGMRQPLGDGRKEMAGPPRLQLMEALASLTPAPPVRVSRAWLRPRTLHLSEHNLPANIPDLTALWNGPT